jgi:hypothetical protein
MEVTFNVGFMLPNGPIAAPFGINRVSHEKEQTWRSPTYP